MQHKIVSFWSGVLLVRFGFGHGGELGNVIALDTTTTYVRQEFGLPLLRLYDACYPARLRPQSRTAHKYCKRFLSNADPMMCDLACLAALGLRFLILL